MPVHIAGSNDCIYSIASLFGYSWDVIWNHPENKGLQEQGRTPYCLQKGDSVFIPPVTPKFVSVQTGKAYHFELSLPPVEFRLTLQTEDEKPRKNLPYELVIENKVYQGQTDEQGSLCELIPPHATQAILRLFEQRKAKKVMISQVFLSIGGLDPVTSTTGVQGRLENLGIPCGRIDGDHGPRTREAIGNFQRLQSLPIDGENTPETQHTLIKCYEHKD